MARTAFVINNPSGNVTVNVDVSLYNLITVNNTSNFTVTVNLNISAATSGLDVYVKRYDDSSQGRIVIISNNVNTPSQTASIQNASGAFRSSLYLSTAYGQRAVGFIFRGNWENINNAELDTEAFWINNVKFFGAVGDAVTDDTAAIQRAINYAVGAASPQFGEAAPSVNNKEVIVYFPRGTYKITQTINVYGSVVLRGCAGGTYACSTILQVDPTGGYVEFTMLFLQPDLYDGISNSTVVEDLAFKSATQKPNPGLVAQIKTASQPNTSAPGYPGNNTPIQTNSIYIRNCWFKSPQRYAIDITQGDDIQITGCTFDVAPYNFVRLGANAQVANISITNNTFFTCVFNCIEALNIYGGTISNNRVYNGTQFSIADSVFFNGTGGVLKHVTISTNETSRVNRVIKIPGGALTVAINGNVCNDVKDYFIQLAGTSVVYNMAVNGNAINSLTNFSRPAIDDGGPNGTPIQNSIFMGNTFFSQTTSATGIRLQGTNTSGNLANGFNVFINFTTPYVL